MSYPVTAGMTPDEIVEARSRGANITYEAAVIGIANVDEFGAMTRPCITALNRAMRMLDQSHLLPIRGRFDATQRAIRRVRDTSLRHGDPCPLEYVLAVDREIGQIVNDDRNW